MTNTLTYKKIMIAGSFYPEWCLTLNFSLHNEAIKLIGELAIDECFGYVPLIGLGGNRKVITYKKVKTREHIELISELVGEIGM